MHPLQESLEFETLLASELAEGDPDHLTVGSVEQPVVLATATTPIAFPILEDVRHRLVLQLLELLALVAVARGVALGSTLLAPFLRGLVALALRGLVAPEPVAQFACQITFRHFQSPR